MATNASRIFLVKWNDKGKVAYGAPKITIQDTHKIEYTCIIYIINSFINSKTTALLHLTSFTEGVSLSEM